MDQFLRLFGDVTITRITDLIVSLVFVFGALKIVGSYFAKRIRMSDDEKDHLQKVFDQVEQYPKWRQQSIDIRDKLSDSIDDLGKKIDQTNDTLSDIKNENEVSRANMWRYRILRFDDEVRHKDQHSKEHFDQILEDITNYEIYCKDHPEYENNRAKMAIENIKDVYRRCEKEGTFL